MSLIVDPSHARDDEGGTNAATRAVFPGESVFDCEIVILREEEGFSSLCSRLPGVAGEGDTVDEAVKSVTAALSIALKIYLEEGTISWEDNPIEGDVECKKRILINA